MPSAISVSSGTIPLLHATLNAPVAWCSSTTDQNQYFQIDLGRKRAVRGAVIQGSPQEGTTNWVNRFHFKYGDTNSSLTTYARPGPIKVEILFTSSTLFICTIWIAKLITLSDGITSY